MLNSFHNPLKQYLCNSGYMSSEFFAVGIHCLNNLKELCHKGYTDVLDPCSPLPIGV
ncbi:hypothetical protein EMIT0P260_50270 [Pseudomonas sp. IT-P260]